MRFVGNLILSTRCKFCRSAFWWHHCDVIYKH